MPDTPVIAQKAPYPVEVTEGRNLFLVRLWALTESTLLRWQPQGHQLYPGQACRRG